MSHSSSIMEFSQDLSTQEAPPPLPAGVYPAEITAVQSRVSTNTGNKYASITFRINADAYPADFEGDPDGTTLTYNRMLLTDTPRARYGWRRFLENVGGRLSNQLDLMDLIGLSASVEITHQLYEGEQQAQIAKVLAP